MVVTLCVTGPKGRTRSSWGGQFIEVMAFVSDVRGGCFVLCLIYLLLEVLFVFGFVLFGFGLFCVLYAVFIFLCNFKHAASLEKVELHPLPHSALPSP